LRAIHNELSNAVTTPTRKRGNTVPRMR
jgi:hypothetical protein